MSHLQERIRRTVRVETRPIGFGTTTQTDGPSMLLLASLPIAMPKEQPGPLPVDAVLFDMSDLKDHEQDLRRATEALGDIPCGVRLLSADRATAAALKEVGADYLVFDVEQSDASLLLEEKLGLVVSASTEMSEGLLRGLGSLPLDALFVDIGNDPLSVRRLIELQRLAGVAQQGLLLKVADQPEADVLESLRNAGGVGIIVEVAGWSELPGLEALRKRIAELPPRRRRREERLKAVLPSIGAPGEPMEEEEENFR